MKTLHVAALMALGLAAPALAAEIAITQSNQTFSSEKLTIHAGDSVKFDNADTVAHNITVKAGSGAAEDLGVQGPGGSVSYTFANKGAYKVVCTIHPRMKMSVAVD